MDIALETRPGEPADGLRFCRLSDRPSPETIYRRFHAPLRSPAANAHRLLEVDHHLREASVAVVDGEVVGVARHDRWSSDPATVDVAVLVQDRWQGIGVGRELLTRLAEATRRRGIHTVTADVRSDNDRVLGLVRHLLPGASLTYDSGPAVIRSPLPRLPAHAS